MSNGNNLRIIVFGGTGAGEDVSDDAKVKDIRPKRGKVEEVLHHNVGAEVKGLFRSIDVEEADPFQDSGEARCDTIEGNVNTLREHVRRRVGKTIVIVGTDNAAEIIQAVADGIDPEKLENNSILFTIAMEAVPKRRRNNPASLLSSDFPGNLTNAIYLSSRDELEGKMALYCDGNLFAPRGLHKVLANDTFQPFISRYESVTTGSNPPVYNWSRFNIDVDSGTKQQRPRNVLRPTGTSGRFKLLPGIESVTADALSNYRNLVAFIKGGILEGTLNGFVLQLPGIAYARRDQKEDMRNIMEAASIAYDAGVPFIVISDPDQRQVGTDRVQTIAATPTFYRGSVGRTDIEKSIINCSPLSLAETKIRVAESAYRSVKYKQLHGSDIVDDVRLDLDAYQRFVTDQISFEEYMKFRRARSSM